MIEKATDGVGADSGSSGPYAIAVLGAFGLVAMIGGIACIRSSVGRSVTIVDSESRPVHERATRGLMRAGRATLGVITATLGGACLVDVVRNGWEGRVGLGQAVEHVVSWPGGAYVAWLAAALLTVCAVSALARGLATLRGERSVTHDA